MAATSRTTARTSACQHEPRRHQQQPARLPRHRRPRRRPEGRLHAAGQRRTPTPATSAPASRPRARSKFWNRRSTVSLFSNAGELRLGRDYTPTFWNQTIFDAFGTNGLGSSLNVAADGYDEHVRADNSIGYFLPAQHRRLLRPGDGAAGEAAASRAVDNDRPLRRWSPRLRRRPVRRRVSRTRQPEQCASIGPRLGGSTQKTYNVGGAYDFGFLKLMGYYRPRHARRTCKREPRARSAPSFRWARAKFTSATTAAS